MRAIDLRPLVITGNESAAWSIGSNSIDLHLVREPSIRAPPLADTTPRMDTILDPPFGFPSLTFPSVPLRFFASIAISSRRIFRLERRIRLSWRLNYNWIVRGRRRRGGKGWRLSRSPRGGERWLNMGWTMMVGDRRCFVTGCKGGSGCWLWLIRLVNLAGIAGIRPVESKRLDERISWGRIEINWDVPWFFFFFILIGKRLTLIGRILKILNDFSLLIYKIEFFNKYMLCGKMKEIFW